MERVYRLSKDSCSTSLNGKRQRQIVTCIIRIWFHFCQNCQQIWLPFLNIAIFCFNKKWWTMYAHAMICCPYCHKQWIQKAFLERVKCWVGVGYICTYVQRRTALEASHLTAVIKWIAFTFCFSIHSMYLVLQPGTPVQCPSFESHREPKILVSALFILNWNHVTDS